MVFLSSARHCARPHPLWSLPKGASVQGKGRVGGPYTNTEHLLCEQQGAKNFALFHMMLTLILGELGTIISFILQMRKLRRKVRLLSWGYPANKPEQGLVFLFCFVFCLFVFLRAASMAYGSSQARVGLELQLLAYTTAHGNAWSLTHWLGPKIEPASSWMLVGFITTEPWQGLPRTRSWVGR